MAASSCPTGDESAQLQMPSTASILVQMPYLNTSGAWPRSRSFMVAASICVSGHTPIDCPTVRHGLAEQWQLRRSRPPQCLSLLHLSRDVHGCTARVAQCPLPASREAMHSTHLLRAAVQAYSASPPRHPSVRAPACIQIRAGVRPCAHTRVCMCASTQGCMGIAQAMQMCPALCMLVHVCVTCTQGSMGIAQTLLMRPVLSSARLCVCARRTTWALRMRY